MGLAHRIIPSLLFNGDKLIKGKRFDGWRSVGHVVQAAKIYGQRAADEIILLDIGATPEGRGPNLKVVEKIADHFFTPLTVGGGVRTIDDVRDLLKAGADKVSINTAAMTSPNLIQDVAEKFGSQAIVVAIDVKDGKPMTKCGTESPVAWGPMGCALWASQRGAGEIMLTSIDREGTMNGYDLALIESVSKSVQVPVIAHGGCKDYADMAKAIEAGASAVAAGALFAFTDCTPRSAARYLSGVGIEARVI